MQSMTKPCPNPQCGHACYHKATLCEDCGWDFLEEKVPSLCGNRLRSLLTPTTLPELHHGDCLQVLRTLPDHSVDLLLTDPPYPCIERDYGMLTEQEWHDLMTSVVHEARRVVKPTGSAVFILQPNSVRVGKMRLWLWEFLLRTAKFWNYVQDAYWCNTAALPNVHCQRKHGLMRPSVKYCLWFGDENCYRNQGDVLWEPCEGMKNLERRVRGRNWRPSGYSVDDVRLGELSAERGGSTPYNLLPFPNTGGRDRSGNLGHGAGTPVEVASWWVRYLCPPNGTVLDPFMGVASIGLAVAESGKGRSYIGIERHENYFTIADQRLKIRGDKDRPEHEP